MSARIWILTSWVASSAIVGVAIFSTPYMERVVAGKAVESLGESLFALAVGALLCGWPWLKALALPESAKSRQIAFAVISVVIAAAFFVPISTGRDFAIGLNTIFAVLAIWVAYPFTRAIK